MIPVSLLGPRNTIPTEGLLDTGADDAVFPESMANLIGVDLKNAPQSQLTTATLANALIRYAQVSLRVTDGKERREWPWVGFTPAKLQTPLLGFAGFLQFFTATFCGDREEVELTVNSLYPGS
jgi:hypothetical protein